MTKSKPKALDPLIAALVAQLPTEGGAFSEDEQVRWLKKMAMGLGLVFGGDAAGQLTAKNVNGADTSSPSVTVEVKPAVTPPAPAPRAKPQMSQFKFVIDVHGAARRGSSGQPIMPDDIEANEILYDMRGGEADLGSIIWADGSMGLPAASLDIADGTLQ